MRSPGDRGGGRKRKKKRKEKKKEAGWLAADRLCFHNTGNSSLIFAFVLTDWHRHDTFGALGNKEGGGGRMKRRALIL